MCQALGFLRKLQVSASSSLSFSQRVYFLTTWISPWQLAFLTARRKTERKGRGEGLDGWEKAKKKEKEHPKQISECLAQPNVKNNLPFLVLHSTGLTAHLWQTWGRAHDEPETDTTKDP